MAIRFLNSQSIDGELTVTGNVGIGTTSPSLSYGGKGLQIQNTDTAGLRLTDTTGADFDISARSGDVLLYEGNGNPIRIGVGGNEKMRITNNGRVGIGTTSPQRILDIGGTGQISFLGGGLTTNSTAGIYWYNDDRYGIYRESGAWGAPLPRLMIEWARGISLDTDGVGDNIVMANSGGNVGIGTTSPSEKLVVIGKTLVSDDGVDDFIKQSVNNNISTLAFGNTEGTGGIAKWQYNRSTGNFSGLVGTAAATKFMTIKPSGNIGIGDDDPDGLLSLKGEGAQIIIDDIDTTDNPRLRFRESGATSGSIYTDASELIFDSGTSEKMRIDSSGNVGIGTTNPGHLLDVQATTDPSIRVRSSGTGSSDDALVRIRIGGSTANSSILFGDSASSTSGQIIYSHSVDAMRLYTAGAEKMRISSTGNVGIGTTNPEALLHVAAADGVTGVLKIEGGKSTVTSIGEINSQLDFGSNDSSVSSTGNVGGRIASVTEFANGADTGMAFYTFEQGAVGDDLSEKLRITNAGNVGIGTTSPNSELHIASGNPVLTLQDTNSNDPNAVKIEFTDQIDDVHAEIGLTAGNSGALNIKNNYKAIDFYTGTSGTSTLAMQIDDNGNVGIGITNPTAKLHVNGGLRVATVNEATTYSADKFLVSDAENVKYVDAVQLASLVNPYITGSYNWRLQGDTGVAALISSGATVDIAGGTGISTAGGSTTLTVNLDDTAVTAGSYTAANITVDAQGRITAAANGSGGGITTVNGGTYITTTNSTGPTVTINHDSTTRVDTLVGSSPSYSFIAVETIDTNATGHITGVNRKTFNVPVPISPNWNLSGDSGTNQNIGNSDTVDIAGGTGISTVASATDTLTINLDNTAVTAGAYTSANITIDAQGRITAAANGSGGGGGKFVDGTDTNDAVYTTGNVGIGTTSPNTLLEIASGNSGGDAALDSPTFRINNTTDSADWDVDDVVGSIEYYSSDIGGNAPYVTSFIKSVNENDSGTLPSGALTFGTATYNAAGGAIERLRITADGDVGIGTTIPSYLLDLQDTNSTSIRVKSTGTGATDNAFLRLEIGGTTAANAIAFGSASNAFQGQIRYVHQTNYMAFHGNGNLERMRIDSSGNVGIGTTSPGAVLTVGDSTSTGNYILVEGSNADNTYTVFEGKRKYPRITLNDTIGATFSLWNLGSTLRFGTNVSTQADAAWYTKSGVAGNVIFNGNVGIGISNPTQKLHVSGNARVTGAYYDSSNLPGTSGQVLSSTATGTSWIDAAGGGGLSYASYYITAAGAASTNLFINGTLSTHITPVDISFSSSNGRFTFAKAGKYKLDFGLIVSVPGTATTVNVTIVRNSTTTLHTMNFRVHSAVDPVERSAFMILEFSQNDYIDVNSTSALITNIGTSVTMVELVT